MSNNDDDIKPGEPGFLPNSPELQKQLDANRPAAERPAEERGDDSRERRAEDARRVEEAKAAIDEATASIDPGKHLLAEAAAHGEQKAAAEAERRRSATDTEGSDNVHDAVHQVPSQAHAPERRHENAGPATVAHAPAKHGHTEPPKHKGK